MDAWSFQPMIGQTSLHLTWKRWLAYRCTITFDVTPLNRELCMSRSMPTPLTIDLMKSNPHWSPFLKELPSVVPPMGLTAERQWYLYDIICPFCPGGDKDTACPLPDVPKPGSGQGTPARCTLPLSEDDVNSPSKGRCLCGICRQEGHNCYSCPNKEA